MRAEDLSEAVGLVDDELIEEARKNRSPQKTGGKRPIRITIAACAACLGIVGTAVLAGLGEGGISGNIRAKALFAAEYPENVPYPDEQSCVGIGGVFDSDKFERMYEPWQKQNAERRTAAQAVECPADFYSSAINEFLSGADGENRICSPVNLYMALSVLAETAGGETRRQILDLLGADNIDALRVQAENMWRANYRDDGACTSVPANSVWLSENIGYSSDTLKTLADKYYASSFSGDPASDEMTSLLQSWLNKQTGGLLEEQAQSVQLEPEMLLTLCSTMYFRAKWSEKFQNISNSFLPFHSPDGDVKTEFMNRTLMYGPYFFGEDYGAVRLSFTEGGSMWLILPDEDKTVEDVLSSGEYLQMLIGKDGALWENNKSLKVHLSVPKFDVVSDIELSGGLKSLGVTDAFDADEADFSPLLAESAAFVSSAKHAARVTIDEEGVTAAAFTAMAVAGAAMPPEDEMDFILDRPFIFVIANEQSQPLFAGVVNKP